MTKGGFLIRFVVGTRFYESDVAKAKDALAKLSAFCGSALSAGADKVYVAVNIDQDNSGCLGQQNWPEGVFFIPVTPWGKFVPALNAILRRAVHDFGSEIGMLVASVEVLLTRTTAIDLMSEMDEDTLVVGACLTGHDYTRSGIKRQATGSQVPWNTCALWHAGRLSRTGFLHISDGAPGEPEIAGVEEVVAIAFQQERGLEGSTAKLKPVPGVSWDTSELSPERLAAHQKKMAAKNSRPARQLEILSLPAPTVIHI